MQIGWSRLFCGFLAPVDRHDARDVDRPDCVSDAQFENVVSDLHAVSSTLIDGGFGEQILCAVFPFRNEKSIFWIYNYKRGDFYPFVPTDAKQHKRDYAYEFRLRVLSMKSRAPDRARAGTLVPAVGRAALAGVTQG